MLHLPAVIDGSLSHIGIAPRYYFVSSSFHLRARVFVTSVKIERHEVVTQHYNMFTPNSTDVLNVTPLRNSIKSIIVSARWYVFVADAYSVCGACDLNMK